MSGSSPRSELARRLRGVLLDTGEASARRVSGTDAAVLVPLYVQDDGTPAAVLTHRRHDLRSHAGEISFPGGRRDPEDADLIATALRETHEEIGLHGNEVEIVGALEPTPTIATGYAIYPFVGLIEPGCTWAPHEYEVAEVLEVPLATLGEVYERRLLRRHGIPFRTHAFPLPGRDDLVIWGATGRILRGLLDVLEQR